MLNKGDHTVYGIHGLCRVEDILVPSFIERGKERDYYMMIAEDDARGVLYVPVDSEKERLREVTEKSKAKKLMDHAGDVDELDICGGKKSEPVVCEIIKRNRAEEMMSLVKTLHLLRRRREEEYG